MASCALEEPQSSSRNGKACRRESFRFHYCYFSLSCWLAWSFLMKLPALFGQAFAGSSRAALEPLDLWRKTRGAIELFRISVQSCNPWGVSVPLWLPAKGVFPSTLQGWSQFGLVEILHNHLSAAHVKTSVREPNLWPLGQLLLGSVWWFPEKLLHLLEMQK